MPFYDVRVSTLYNEVREDVAISLHIDPSWTDIGKITIAERNLNVKRIEGRYEKGSSVYNWKEPHRFTISDAEAFHFKKLIEYFIKNKSLNNKSYRIERTVYGTDSRSKKIKTLTLTENDGSLALVSVDPSAKTKELIFIINGNDILKKLYTFFDVVASQSILIKSIFISISNMVDDKLKTLEENILKATGLSVNSSPAIHTSPPKKKFNKKTDDSIVNPLAEDFSDEGYDEEGDFL